MKKNADLKEFEKKMSHNGIAFVMESNRCSKSTS